MTSYKIKAVIAGSISIIIISAITFIALWPTNTQSDVDELSPSDVGDVINDSSRLNLVNLHMRVTNHTIITTSTMVVVGLIILISFSVKCYTSHKRRKKEAKRSREQRSQRNSRDFSMAMSTKGTWENPRPLHMEQTWNPRQYPSTQGWGHPGVQPQHPQHLQHPHPPQPQPQPRQPREDQPAAGTEFALVHTANRGSSEENQRMGQQWKQN